MKTTMIRVPCAHYYEGIACRHYVKQVKAIQISKFLLVTLSVEQDAQGEYVITHAPTGYRIPVLFDSAYEAMTTAHILNRLNLDWKFFTISEMPKSTQIALIAYFRNNKWH